MDRNIERLRAALEAAKSPALWSADEHGNPVLITLSEEAQAYNDKVKEEQLDTQPYTALPLSVSIICTEEDAEQYLPGCLASLPQGCEVIIVYCTVDDAPGRPGTEIPIGARMEGGRQIREYRAYFSSPQASGRGKYEFTFDVARTLAQRHCSKTWILSIDADERLLPHQHDRLIELIETAHPTMGGFLMSVAGLAHVEGADGTRERFITRVLRLYRNVPEAVWIGLVHEQIGDGLSRAGYQIIDTEMHIHHTGYDDKEGVNRKLARNLRLLLLSLLHNPHDERSKKHLQQYLQ